MDLLPDGGAVGAVAKPKNAEEHQLFKIAEGCLFLFETTLWGIGSEGWTERQPEKFAVDLSG